MYQRKRGGEKRIGLVEICGVYGNGVKRVGRVRSGGGGRSKRRGGGYVKERCRGGGAVSAIQTVCVACSGEYVSEVGREAWGQRGAGMVEGGPEKKGSYKKGEDGRARWGVGWGTVWSLHVQLRVGHMVN